MFSIAKNRLTREEILILARKKCETEGWPWIEPVRILNGLFSWTVVTNYGMRGRNVRIVINKKSSEVAKWSYIPR
jgi:hypothetical protein